jgi:peptidoglycan/LPS O-acetylase OafA/YrhL
MEAKPKKIEDIQILRGIAIVSVLFYHLSISATLLSALPIHLSSPFYSGVDLFFVISGFVVTQSLRRGGYDPVVFVIRRVYRLYPPILVFLALSAVVNTGIRGTGYPAYGVTAFCTSAVEFVRQAFTILAGCLINYPGKSNSYYMNGAMWSLSVEFQFYAAVLLIAIGLVAARLGDRLKDRSLLVVAVVVLAVSIINRLMVLAGVTDHVGYLVAFQFDFMALGVVLAFLPVSWLKQPMSVRKTILCGPVLYVLCQAVLMVCRGQLDGARHQDSLVGFGMVVALATFGTLVVVASRGALGLLLPRGLAHFMVAVGDRSYTLYLLHYPCMLISWVLLVALRANWVFLPWNYAWAQVVSTALFLIPLTELCYRYVELPWSARGRVAGRRISERQLA